MSEGWIKLHRKILEWEWYDDVNVKILFLHLLLIVNIKPQKRHGITIPAGSIDRTYQQLCVETGLTMRKLRTALEKLKMTGEVTVKRQNEFTVFTVVSWQFFQCSDSEMTLERQKGDTLNKKVKKVKNNTISFKGRNYDFEKLEKALVED